jgi:hypothetical protein
MAKAHIEDETRRDELTRWSLCGHMFLASQPERLAASMDDVTCTRCHRELANFLVHEEITLSEEPFAPGPPVELGHAAAGSGTPRVGLRFLGTVGNRVVRESVAGDTERRYAWHSAVQAIAEWAVWRADGQGLASTSAPSRFERAPRGASDPARAVTGQVERLLGVDRALRGAYTAPRTFRGMIDGEGHSYTLTLTVAEQTRVLVTWAQLVWSTRGEDLQKAEVRERVAQLVASLDGAARLTVGITARHVQIIQQDGLEAVTEHLRRIGEIAPERPRGPRKKGGDMAVIGYDLAGWAEISGHLGMSERVCQRLAAREKNPLPVHRIDGVGMVQARREELTGWVERNATSGAA